MFEPLNTLLPVDRAYETQRLLAFHHPKPVYPIQILLVPKKINLVSGEIPPR